MREYKAVQNIGGATMFRASYNVKPRSVWTDVMPVLMPETSWRTHPKARGNVTGSYRYVIIGLYILRARHIRVKNISELSSC